MNPLLINTPLQRGAADGEDIGNRFNGFQCDAKTVAYFFGARAKELGGARRLRRLTIQNLNGNRCLQVVRPMKRRKRRAPVERSAPAPGTCTVDMVLPPKRSAISPLRRRVHENQLRQTQL